MADFTFSRTTQQMTASSFAGLFGLFAGLCAIFAGCVTLGDWYSQTRQARWPVVSAIVERGDVVATSRAPKDGGMVWNLRYRVRYELNGTQLIATPTSNSVFSEAEAAKLRAWAAQHRKGSHIDVRVDPSQENRALFASAEISGDADRMHTDITLFMIAAIASTGLVALAKYLRVREARAAPVADSASRGGLTVGLGCAAMGLMLVGFAINGAIEADPLTADNLMAVPAGLMFVFAGILMALPPEHKKWQTLLAALLITSFALTFDWAAFLPGERKFSGSLMGFGFMPTEYLGRAFFGFFAVILDIWAIKMWIDQCRKIFRSDASTASPADSIV
jgi:Protein of unknown function (DUF3592)